MYIARVLLLRITTSALVLLVLSAVLFIAIETLPGDFAVASAPRFTTSDQIERTRDAIGLTHASLHRYITWLSNAVQGDFGASWSTQNLYFRQ